jgi:hypothetical protein
MVGEAKTKRQIIKIGAFIKTKKYISGYYKIKCFIFLKIRCYFPEIFHKTFLSIMSIDQIKRRIILFKDDILSVKNNQSTVAIRLLWYLRVSPSNTMQIALEISSKILFLLKFEGKMWTTEFLKSNILSIISKWTFVLKINFPEKYLDWI